MEMLRLFSHILLLCMIAMNTVRVVFLALGTKPSILDCILLDASFCNLMALLKQITLEQLRVLSLQNGAFQRELEQDEISSAIQPIPKPLPR